jgi:CBS domain-containing protein
MIEPAPRPEPPPLQDAGGGARALPALAERSLDRPLAELMHRRPVSCAPETPLRAALEAMRAERVGSMIVVDEGQRPLGLLTLGDVLTRVTLPQLPLDTPIGAVMSARLHTLPARAPAFEAALLMARENIRHVPLVEAGRLVGVVSESRLFALWRRSIGAVRAAVVEARSVDALVQAAQGIHALPSQLLREGLKPESITALLTSLNDLLVERLLELSGLARVLEEMHGNWLALGSQGRAEQTLATDQDNAIVFDDAGDPEERRRRLLPLALEVNHALDRCGFDLCRGQIMASNPALCLSLSEWKARFSTWIDRPDAAALLNATIFFDFRALCGARAAARELREWLGQHARGGDRFLTLMVLNVGDNQPPLGVLRDFVLTRGGEHPHTLDLKTNGVQAFVEAARVYALSCGVAATGTVERLEEAGRRRGIPEAETAAWREAFHAIQGLRLALNAGQAQRGQALHNHLDPDALNVLDRNLLKEALRQARSLQGRIARDFSLGGTSVRQ